MRQRAIRDWRKRDFLENAPQLVKEKVFLKYGIPDSQWVETGTYVGVTTKFLSERYPFVYSIEPESALYDRAISQFSQGQGRNRASNVELFNGVSEDVLPALLSKLEGNVNFWLDGHYSGGKTFRGETDCP